ncbi:hypothetical protein [Nocardioides lianchengensis]|uniref:Uncharacterized protein n=1 Tax=Nocardioides lianchengensis TaxID=1045774 RepID=A0A1G6J3E3_9ACTN|nr:hypothetical protein [Nocardioides lianchengensis]NYG12869.1 hypothetical protein [Nocardioides lianchengensis]SDC13179.1 hypothetical protein SAMN05421872_101358 [Nocardioides lianchengensis]
MYIPAGAVGAYLDSPRAASRLLRVQVWTYLAALFLAQLLLTGRVDDESSDAWLTFGQWMVGHLAAGALLGLGYAVAWLLLAQRQGGVRLTAQPDDARPSSGIPWFVWMPLALVVSLVGVALAPLTGAPDDGDLWGSVLVAPVADLTGFLLGTIAGLLTLMPIGLVVRLLRR